MAGIESIFLVGFTFLLAGFIKGIIGLGLPTISLALLTTGFGLLPAMGLMIIPSLVTNLWQAFQGGALLKIARRFWLMMLTVVAGIWIGGKILIKSDMIFLTGLLGVLLCAYSIIGLTSYKISAPGKSEHILSPLVGVISGVLTGLTGTFVIPGVLYLQSIGLDRNMLIQTMGVLFSVSTLALAITLGHNNLFSLNIGAYSLGGVAPAIIGMILGQKVRSKLSENIFTKVFFTSLLLLGFYITCKAFI